MSSRQYTGEQHQRLAEACVRFIEVMTGERFSGDLVAWFNGHADSGTDGSEVGSLTRIASAMGYEEDLSLSRFFEAVALMKIATRENRNELRTLLLERGMSRVDLFMNLIHDLHETIQYTSGLVDGEPCDHPGCLSHQTHPCEGCGRIGERPPPGKFDLFRSAKTPEVAAKVVPTLDDTQIDAAVSALTKQIHNTSDTKDNNRAEERAALIDTRDHLKKFADGAREAARLDNPMISRAGWPGILVFVQATMVLTEWRKKQYPPNARVDWSQMKVKRGEEQPGDREAGIARVGITAPIVLDRKNPFGHARKVMIEAFQNDEDLWRAYRDNIAMTLHDRHGITAKDKRDHAAADIMKLIFETVHDVDQPIPFKVIDPPDEPKPPHVLEDLRVTSVALVDHCVLCGSKDFNRVGIHPHNGELCGHGTSMKPVNLKLLNLDAFVPCNCKLDPEAGPHYHVAEFTIVKWSIFETALEKWKAKQ
jgi:hypothetical protein